MDNFFLNKLNFDFIMFFDFAILYEKSMSLKYILYLYFDRPLTSSEPKKPPAPVIKIVFILYSLVRFVFL
jgi:hypothetical protein